MASGSKADLARAGTMEVTSKEGRAFLEKNLTDWKKPMLIGDNADETSKAVTDKKSKKTTFKVPDVDDDDDSPKTKKARLAKATTMDLTAEEGKQLLRGEKLGDTRLVTHAKKTKEKAAVKRANTMQKAVAEATAYGYGSPSGARGQRKREAAARPAAASKSPKKKPAAKKSAVKKGGLKKAGTMVKTAKEGKRIIGEEQLGDTRQVTKQKQKKQK